MGVQMNTGNEKVRGIRGIQWWGMGNDKIGHG